MPKSHDKYSLSNAEMSPLEKKKQIIQNAMYYNQPTFDDFVGAKGYSDAAIKSDKNKLKQKQDRIERESPKSFDDDFAHDMEPILTYILNDRVLFPTRQNFAFLASEFDDKCKGTDIVFGIQRRDGGFSAYGIDVATGTNPERLHAKFTKTFETFNGVSDIHYCKHDNLRWKERQAPHFVLGMSPASQIKAVDEFIASDNMLQGRNTDKRSDFIILSEIEEQIILHRELLKLKGATNDPLITARAEHLTDLKSAVERALRRTLDIEAKNYGTKQEMLDAFKKEYAQAKKYCAKEDSVYNNIVNEASIRTREAKKRLEHKTIGHLAVAASADVRDKAS